MRFIQLISSTERRGAEVFASGLTKALRDRGHESRLLALHPSTGDQDPDAQVPVDQIICDGEPASLISVGQKIKKLAKEYRAEFVQANGGVTVKFTAAAAWLHPRRSWYFVYRNIGDPEVWLSAPAKRAFYRRLVWPFIDGVISVSQQSKEGLQSVYGSDGPRIEVVYRGVDEEQLAPRISRDEVRKALSIDPSFPVIVWVGALSREKRPDRALRVIKRLNRSPRRHVLLFVGDGSLRQELEAQADILGIASNVRFTGPVADVGTYLNAGDTFLLTSDTEGIPGVVLEAMVVGLPVVTTNVGGVKEVVNHGENGFIVEMGDEDSMVNCLADACSSTIEHPSMGRVAGEEARQKFSMDRCVERYLAFYRSLLEGGRHSRTAK